ncbi:MAG: hypothetical protein K9N07_04715 [Candidatus Cloacimonetes bacterium]|nr:hypothetical protein [Candidatus Cloacimonadota bacterium]
MKFLKSISVIFLLSIFACDRFEHNFEPTSGNISLVEFANSLTVTINNTNQFNYLQLGNLFSEDYFNSDETKDSLIDYFAEFFLIDPNTTFTADDVIISPSLNITWHFVATGSDQEILEDKLFNDYLIEENEGFVLFGDQSNKRKFMVELFTGQWCSNCPNAEEALHELRKKYSSRFNYVEYHIGDQLAGEFANLFSYYPGAGTLPMGVVNGNGYILTEAPSVEYVQSSVESAILPHLQESPEITFSDIQTTLTSTQLNGSVSLSLENSLSIENLFLVAVLMEDYNDEYPNYQGEPHHNIALKRVKIDLSTLNLSDPVSFDLPGLDELPDWYDSLPTDLVLVLWIQKLENEYDQSTCAVYNMIEIPM